MLLILIAIGLAVAGAITDNSAFYWLAGIVGGFVMVFVVFVGGLVRGAAKTVKKGFDDDFFRRPLR